MKRASLAAVVLAIVATPAAHAGLLGSAATFEYYAYGGAYVQGGSPTSFTVDGIAGASFFDPLNTSFRYFDIRVTDNQIVFDFQNTGFWTNSPVSLNAGGLFLESGPLLSFVGADAIQTVSIDPGSNLTGLTPSNITYDGSRVAVNWNGYAFDSTTQVALNLTFAAPVPEPSTAALTAVALAGIVLGTRGRRRG
jgi:hypothetical protein